MSMPIATTDREGLRRMVRATRWVERQARFTEGIQAGTPAIEEAIHDAVITARTAIEGGLGYRYTIRLGRWDMTIGGETGGTWEEIVDLDFAAFLENAGTALEVGTYVVVTPRGVDGAEKSFTIVADAGELDVVGQTVSVMTGLIVGTGAVATGNFQEVTVVAAGGTWSENITLPSGGGGMHDYTAFEHPGGSVTMGDYLVMATHVVPAGQWLLLPKVIAIYEGDPTAFLDFSCSCAELFWTASYPQISISVANLHAGYETVLPANANIIFSDGTVPFATRIALSGTGSGTLTVRYSIIAVKLNL